MIRSFVTHRGIDTPLGTGANDIRGESTWEAFSVQVKNGYGIEFDLQPMSDGSFAICHDQKLTRISGGLSSALISELNKYKLKKITLEDGHLCELSELLALLSENSKATSALHLKKACQNEGLLDLLLEKLLCYPDLLDGRLILFDVIPVAARYLKKSIPNIELAASVSDPYDVERFGVMTGGTLMTIDEVIEQSAIYTWVWLDEWDTLDAFGKTKSLVTRNTIKLLRETGFKIAVVSPELHATSPALSGDGIHEVGINPELLKSYWIELGDLNIDLLCTDHASWIKDYMNKNV
jgi:hypothetical protein